MIALLNYNDFIIEGDSRNSIIKSLYKKKYKKYCNLRLYLTNLKKDSFQNVIYTFSDSNTNLFIRENDIINNKFSFKKTLIINTIENFEIKSLTEKIKCKDYNLFIIRFKEEDKKKIKKLIKIKRIIDDYIKDNNKNKIFLFIIYKNYVI